MSNPSLYYGPLCAVFGMALGMLLMYYVDCRRQSRTTEQWGAQMQVAAGEGGA